MPSLEVAEALLNIGAVGFNPTQPITFKSGLRSPVYVDNRRLPFHPAAWQVVIQAFAQHIQQPPLPVDVIAGVAVGGVPHSAALAYTLSIPSVFVRKEAKEHGKQQAIEGGAVQGQHVVLIEDLVTTAGSSLKAVAALRAEGAVVTDMLAIVSYRFPEAIANCQAAGITLHTLTDFTTILAVVQQRQLLSEEDIMLVQDWLQDPHGWSQRQERA